MKLHVEEVGQENSETIVFLHEASLAGWMWKEQVKSFKDYHLIIPDLPEHGKSANIKPFAIKTAAGLVINIIKTLAHHQEAHLVGVGMGGQLVLEIMDRAPELVGSAMISGVQTSPHTETLLELLDYTLNAYKPVKDTDFFIKARMRTYNISKTYRKDFRESTRQINSDSLKRVLHESMLFQISLRLKGVDAPVLLVLGGKEYEVVKKSAEDLMKVVPEIEVLKIPEIGHIWNLENPELFSRILRSRITNEVLNQDLNCF